MLVTVHFVYEDTAFSNFIGYAVNDGGYDYLPRIKTIKAVDIAPERFPFVDVAAHSRGEYFSLIPNKAVRGEKLTYEEAQRRVRANPRPNKFLEGLNFPSQNPQKRDIIGADTSGNTKNSVLSAVPSVNADINGDDVHNFFGRKKDKKEWKLSKDNIEIVRCIAERLKIPRNLMEFNLFSTGTGYVGKEGEAIDFVHVAGDIITDPNHPCPLKSIEAILSHEHYGHRVNSRKGMAVNKWRDEAHASLTAYELTAGLLSYEQRLELLDDALYKAEFGASELPTSGLEPSDRAILKADEDYERKQLIKEINAEKGVFLNEKQST
jgi:hypothetical protein